MAGHSTASPRLVVVGGPDERRGAEEMESAFAAYHVAVHDLKQLAATIDEQFARLEAARATLRGHGVSVEARFEKHLQAALDRWRRDESRPGDIPAFIERAAE